MSQEPWTLFCPRSGLTPTPGRPMLPVAMARLAMRHDGGRALAVLGNAETVIDRAVAAGGVEPRRGADRLRRNARHLGDGLGTIVLLRDEGGPILEGVPFAAFADELLVDETFGDDDMRQRR